MRAQMAQITNLAALFPVAQALPPNANLLLPKELQHLRFLSWRKKKRRDILRPWGAVPVAITGTGIDLEKRKPCNNPDVVKLFQSFPPAFRILGSHRTQKLKQVSNAVPPFLMWAIAKQVAQELFKMAASKLDQKDFKSYVELLNAAWALHLAPRATNAPTVISLFAGCGGSSLGYSMAGYRELLAVDFDEGCAETFQSNFLDIPFLVANVQELSAKQLIKEAGLLGPKELDVLDGSPPCQGFSTAGNRNLWDLRNELYQEFARLLEGVQPKAFIMENVSGMVKGKMRLVFANCTRALKGAGYQVMCRLVDAKWFNVPQERKRLIWLGIRNDLKHIPSWPLAQARPVTIRQAIRDLSEAQNASTDHIWINESPTGRNTRTYQLALKARQGQKYAGHQRRTIWNEPFPTITKSSKEGMNIPPYLRNSHCHPIWTRTFSIRENARAMSFPDDFQFAGMQTDKQSRIGNSVPPLMMRVIAQHIRTEILGRLT